MNNNDPLRNATGINKMGGYAHLPGTGPSHTCCKTCRFLHLEGRKFTCSKYRELTGRKGQEISPTTASCRYYEPALQKRHAFDFRG